MPSSKNNINPASDERSAQDLFDSLAPPETDETVREYVCSLLKEAADSADQDDDENNDELISTLQAFLGEDDDKSELLARELVQQWMKQKGTAAAASSKIANENVVDNQEQMNNNKGVTASLQIPLKMAEEYDAKSEINNNPIQEKEAEPTAKPATKISKQQKKKKANKMHPKSKDEDEVDKDQAQNWAVTDDDDFATAWKECQQQGVEWGGRGKGGRGVQAGSNSIQSNIHLANVTVSVPGGGLELLNNATIDLVRGHRYGLVGRNGCGKSTLLKRLAQKNIPGIPQDLNILLVQQEMEGSETESALQVLLKADVHREVLLQQQEQLEQQLEAIDDHDTALLEELAERLGEISEEIDAMNPEYAETRATEILKGLQFTDNMIHSPTQKLSGGWRVRLALARALFVPSDVLLLDETSNHLDIWGVQWLTNYLTTSKDPHKVVVAVSHDRAFLNSICTDIMVIENGKLKTYPGNWDEYERQQEEKTARQKQILDASERQRAKADKFIQKQQAIANKKSADPNKQRQAKMIKEKKLDRIGNYREDGKRYKNFSLAKLSENSIRLAEKVVIEGDEPVVRMKFPDPAWPPGVAPGSPLVQLEDFSFGYRSPEDSSDEDDFLLRDMTLNINRGSKIALVGRNGSGKSTLLKLITGDIRIPDPEKYIHQGDLSWKHPTIRAGHMTQYSVEELDEFANLTVLEYAEEKLKRGKASSEIISGASGNVRQYLGAFGLGGAHAHRPIGKLSGGERMRLCFATVFSEEPHILILDESTNHVDVETLDSIAAALNTYQGAVLMVSHNQSFLSGFCKELWVVDDSGHVSVNYDDTESFDELFSDYRNSVLSDIGGDALTNRRREKASMAKKATQHRAGASQKTALL